MPMSVYSIGNILAGGVTVVSPNLSFQSFSEKCSETIHVPLTNLISSGHHNTHTKEVKLH